MQKPNRKLLIFFRRHKNISLPAEKQLAAEDIQRYLKLFVMLLVHLRATCSMEQFIFLPEALLAPPVTAFTRSLTRHKVRTKLSDLNM
jgi:hypothetical protein